MKEENKKLREQLIQRNMQNDNLGRKNKELEEENKKFKDMYNVYVTGTLKLKEENKKLKNKIKNLKFVRRTIENCVVLAFLCLICSGVVCMFIETMIDVITGFQFVRYL